MRRMLILYNPKAGGLKGREKTERGDCDDTLKEAVSAMGLEATLEPTPPPAELKKRLQEAEAHNYEVVVAAGGDGTVRPIAQALLGTSLCLGVLPVGTDNNFAHSLGVPFDLKEALQVLKEGKQRRVDVGRVGEETFLEAAGVGLFAQVISLFGPDGPSLFRFLRDGKMLLPLLLNPPARRLRLVLDGTTYAQEATMVSVCNSIYLGAQFAVAPDAKLDDGLFDVVIVGPLSRWELLRFAFALRFGNNLHLPKVSRVRARHVEISRVYRQHHPLPVHVDDHIGAHTPVTIEVVPQALCVIAP